MFQVASCLLGCLPEQSNGNIINQAQQLLHSYVIIVYNVLTGIDLVAFIPT